MPNTKVIIAGVAFAAAVVIFFMRGSGDEAVPDTDDSRTNWICLACQKPFTLTASEYESESVRANSTGLLYCPGCSEQKGVRAATCATCQTMFATMDAEGTSLGCPKCNPIVVTSKTKQDEPGAEPEPDAPVEEEAGKAPITFAE